MTTLKLAPVFQQLLTRVTDRSIPIYDPVEVSFAGLGQAYRNVGNKTNGLVTDIILGDALSNDFVVTDDWSHALDPLSVPERVAAGELGRMFGATVWTTSVLDKGHPQGEKLRSLPGLIFLTTDGTFFFYEVSVVAQVFKRLRRHIKAQDLITHDPVPLSPREVMACASSVFERGQHRPTDIIVSPTMWREMTIERSWIDLLDTIVTKAEQTTGLLGKFCGMHVWSLVYERADNPVFYDLRLPGFVMLTPDDKAYHYTLQPDTAMHQTTPGEHAYRAYNYGDAAQQMERSTVAPLPFALLSALDRARWEDVAKAVVPGLGSATSAAINLLTHLRDNGGLKPADQVEATRVITRLQQP